MIYKVLLLIGAVVTAFSGALGALRKLEDFGPPQPYQFGYKVKDSINGDQWRTEARDGSGKVTGTYGYYDPNGYHRQVDYIADENGFRAKVRSNEPGLDAEKPANVDVQGKAKPHHYFEIMKPRTGMNLNHFFKPNFRHRASPSEPDIVIIEGGNSEEGKSSQTPWYPMDTIISSD